MIMDYFQVSRPDAGLVSTMFFISYGIGQLLHGILCRFYNKKYVLFIGMAVASSINLAMGFGLPFEAYKYLWFINGCALSVLWSSMLLLFDECVSDKYSGKIVLIMCTVTATGAVVSYGASALFSLFTDFKASFIFGGVALFTIALVWLLSYNRLTVKDGRNKQSDSEIQELPNIAQPQPRTRAGVGSVILVVILCFFAIVNNFGKDGLEVWLPEILKSTFGFGDSLSIALSIILPVVAIFGAFIAKALHDKIPNFIVLEGVFFLGIGAFITGAYFLLNVSAVPVVVLLGVARLLMGSAGSTLSTIVPLYMKNKFNAGFLAGLIDGMCYVGSAISSLTLGVLVDAKGWSGVFLLLIVLEIILIAVCVVYVIVTGIKSRPNKTLGNN